MDMEIRKEDLGKMMLKNAEILNMDIVKDALNQFFKDTRNAIYLLYSQDLNYFTVFRNNSLLSEQTTDKFIEFANESTYYVHGTGDIAAVYKMNEILEVEYNKNINAVEIWIGNGNPHYFQLMPWDESSVHI